MKKSDRSFYVPRWGAVLLLLALPLGSAYARARKPAEWANAQFESAERTREALTGRPLQDRTRSEFQRAINAYRRVYLGAPASGKAAASVMAEAEVMVEMGRQFHDDKILRAAIGKYEFLRREYPGSSNRIEALFTIAEIYKEDLKEDDQANEVFQQFLKRYPHHHLACEARKAIDSDGAERASARTEDTEGSDGEKILTKKTDSKVSDPIAEKSSPGGEPVRVTGIRYWSSPDYTRIAIDLEQDVKYHSQRIAHPDRVYFDLIGTKLASTLIGKNFDVNDGFLKQIRAGQFQSDRTRIVLDVDSLSEFDTFLLSNPSRLIIDVHGKQPLKVAVGKEVRPVKAPVVAKVDPPVVSSSPKKVVVDADDDDTAPDKAASEEIKRATAPVDAPAPRSSSNATVARGRRKSVPMVDAREAQPTASGDRSLIRALGLKIGKIVIDPGHGGHDVGTIGPHGLLEKDLVLDVGRRLGKLLDTRLGADVVFTRDDDTFIPLETRTAIANQDQADLFVSIHANSSRDPDARGVETYYLNFTSSSDALDVAARENAVSDTSIHELQDLVKKIALKEKIEESREFASDVQHALHNGLSGKTSGIRDRGVKKAPFIVLIGANMPSILAEISFVSNPTDERKLKTPEYRQKIAESLYRGISKYVGGLSGVKVASRVEKNEGQ